MKMISTLTIASFMIALMGASALATVHDNAHDTARAAAFETDPGAELEASLILTVDGASSSSGAIIATLFASKSDYMKTPHREQTAELDADGRATFQFDDLEPGSYALSVFHDANANGELDTNFIGIPKEKIGFSNNARPSMGPASFEAARFEIAAPATEHAITLGKARKN